MHRDEREPLARSDTDAALLWESFCERLKDAGDVLRRAETPRDERTLAEAYRHLVRMVRVGFENTFELADLERPRLTEMAGAMVQYEGITSDARYLHARIDGAAPHRVHGWRGDAPLFEIGTYTGKMGLHDPSHLIESITEETLVVDDRGRVEIWLSPEEPAALRGGEPGNWIRTDAATRYLMIRQYAPDWRDVRPGHFALVREDAPGPRGSFGLEAIREGLRATAGFAARNPAIWAGISDYWAGHAVNRIEPELGIDARTDIAPPSGHLFACGYLDLPPDHVLLIDFLPGEAAYWSLGLANYWYETIGYDRPESNLNSASAVADADGRIRVAIAHERPPTAAGIPNWIDPKGHRHGTIVFRWSRPVSPIPGFDCRLVARSALG